MQHPFFFFLRNKSLSYLTRVFDDTWTEMPEIMGMTTTTLGEALGATAALFLVVEDVVGANLPEVEELPRQGEEAEPEVLAVRLVGQLHRLTLTTVCGERM